MEKKILACIYKKIILYILSAVRRLRQEAQEFKVRLNSIMKVHISERDSDQTNST